jgi:hypothetical protein
VEVWGAEGEHEPFSGGKGRVRMAGLGEECWGHTYKDLGGHSWL